MLLKFLSSLFQIHQLDGLKYPMEFIIGRWLIHRLWALCKIAFYREWMKSRVLSSYSISTFTEEKIITSRKCNLLQDTTQRCPLCFVRLMSLILIRRNNHTVRGRLSTPIYVSKWWICIIFMNQSCLFTSIYASCVKISCVNCVKMSPFSHQDLNTCSGGKREYQTTCDFKEYQLEAKGLVLGQFPPKRFWVRNPNAFREKQE